MEIAEELKKHDGHEIGIDRFAQIPGVRRSVPGNAYCFTCKEPIPGNYSDLKSV